MESGTAAAAAAPAIDYDKIAAAVAAALGTSLAAANKSLLERLEKLQAPAPAAEATPAADPKGKGADAAKPLTLEDIAKLIDTKFGQRDEQGKVSAARDKFITEKMKDIPPEFLRDMPATDDVTKLATAEQAIRGRVQEIFKAAGIKAPGVGGDNPAGKKPGEAVDLSKLTPEQKIEMALKDKPMPGAPV